MRPSVLLLLGVLAAPPLEPIECVVVSAKYVMSEKTVERVFSGRVIEITRTADTAYRATFEVDRVWKGTVPRRFDVYVLELSPNSPRYEKGQRYTALSTRLHDSEKRKKVGLGATEQSADIAVDCSAFLAPTIERDLGPGYAPSEPKEASQ